MKSSSALKFLLIPSMLLIFACATSEPTPDEPSVPDPGPPSDPPAPFESFGLMEFTGDGYSFFYPQEATIEISNADAPVTSVVTVQGPDVLQCMGQAEWTGPGYTIVVRTYDNPDGLDAEAYGRAFLISLWERILAEGGPLSIPVSQEGVIREEDVGTATVAGLPAFYVEWFGGDHARMEFFIANGDQVVSFSFGDYPVPNQPINEVQQGIYSLIMSTLELESD